VWKSLQAVISIWDNMYIQYEPFPLASLLLFSVEDSFQCVAAMRFVNCSSATRLVKKKEDLKAILE